MNKNILSKILLEKGNLNRRLFLVGIIASIIGSILGVILPLILKNFIDDFVNHKKISYTLWFVIIIFFLQNVFNFFGTYNLAKVGIESVTNLRNNLIITISNAKLRALDKVSSGELSSRILNDTSVLNSMVSYSFPNFFIALISIILIIFILFYLNIQLTLVLFLWLVPLVLIYLMVGKKFERYSFDIQQNLSNFNSTLVQSLINIKSLKANCLERDFIDKIEAINRNINKIGFKSAKLVSATQISSTVIVSSELLIVLLYGSFGIKKGTLSLGELLAYLVLLLQLISPIMEIGEFYTTFQQAKGSTLEVNNILNYESESNKGDIPLEIKELIFKNVSFGYTQDKLILKNVNFCLKQGEALLITGKNGSGKSTLTYLISQFYRPIDGTIEINGNKNISEFNVKKWRSKIGYVGQEHYLSSGTIKEYLTTGLNTNIEEIEKACSIVGLMNFIKKLDNGFDHPISELGKNFSGGQQQRLNLARILLQDSEIYIFDEANSNVDKDFHSVFNRIIKDLKKNNKIVFVISHRESYWNEDYEKIICLEDIYSN